MTKTKKPTAEDLAGFHDVDTELDQYDAHEWDTDPICFGTVVKIKDATVQRNGEDVETQFAVIETAKGPVNMWHTANLDELFNVMEPGGQVFVEFLQKVPLTRGRTMRTFNAKYRP